MTNHCPTCGAAVRVETSGRTSYMVPTDAERVQELEDRIRELEAALREMLEIPYIRGERKMLNKGIGTHTVTGQAIQQAVETLEPPR